MIKERTSDQFVYFRHTQIKTSLQSLELGRGSCMKNPETEESERKYSVQSAMDLLATTFSRGPSRACPRGLLLLPSVLCPLTVYYLLSHTPFLV